MAKMCPKCSGGSGDDLEGMEEDRGLCIHEKIGVTAVVLVAGAGILVGSGIL